jgi:hypothetical protein
MAAAAGSVNKTIVMSDVESALPLLKHNVESNQHLISKTVTVQTKALNWETDSDMQTYDLVVGSDLLYNVELIPALISTLKRHTTKHILLAVRWRKPDLERCFFQNTSDSVDWKLVDTLKCMLPWQTYGNPTNNESNAFFLQTMVAVNASLKSLAAISEQDLDVMSKEEHDTWERLQIQVYLGTVKAIGEDRPETTKRARVD